ncbi:hypothetical protein JWZ98_10060 [Methylomonas sp. EFPC1]|uniref:hypothetical protein n=1 Tax=Methylomonas sp. EFPC1 TaxID=2812647 RepID=UPI00196780B0|nr:hypothetical protein [Methylomonas sp. EFPC1]QSB03239.1 hypothetical protein JWZ98_10060 [Methylomonas sp. EFPC1]
MKYSASTGGFYLPTQNCPPDSVDISDALYRSILSARASGKQVVADTGGMPTAIDRPIITPVVSATAYQIRQALTQKGWRDEFEAIIAAGPQDIRDAWECESNYLGNNEKIAYVAGLMNKTSGDIADLFALAVTLKP